MNPTYKDLSEKLAANYARTRKAHDEARGIVTRTYSALAQMLGPDAPKDALRIVPPGTSIDDGSVFALPGTVKWLADDRALGFVVILTVRGANQSDAAQALFNISLTPLWDGRFTARVSNRPAVEVDANKHGTEVALASDILEAMAKFVSEV